MDKKKKKKSSTGQDLNPTEMLWWDLRELKPQWTEATL